MLRKTLIFIAAATLMTTGLACGDPHYACASEDVFYRSGSAGSSSRPSSSGSSGSRSGSSSRPSSSGSGGMKSPKGSVSKPSSSGRSSGSKPSSSGSSKSSSKAAKQVTSKSPNFAGKTIPKRIAIDRPYTSLNSVVYVYHPRTFYFAPGYIHDPFDPFDPFNYTNIASPFYHQHVC